MSDSKIVWLIERERDGEFYAGRGVWTHELDSAVRFPEHWVAEQLASTIFEEVTISSIRVEIE